MPHCRALRPPVQLAERGVWHQWQPSRAASRAANRAGGAVSAAPVLSRRRRPTWRCAAGEPGSGPCHYQTLGVPHDADRDEVKQAFRRLARQWHPDVNPSSTATDRFKSISRAFEVLSDEQQRRQYDHMRFGSNSRRPTRGSSSGTRGGRAAGSGAGGEERRPADVDAVLHLDFREAALGAHRSISLDLMDACLQCGGSGGQPGTMAPLCTMCKGRREIVKLQGVGGASGPAGTANWVVCCPVCAGRGFQIRVPCSCCQGAGLSRQARQVAVRVPAGMDDGSILRLAGEGELGRVGGPRGAVMLELKVGQEEGMWRQGLDLHSQLTVPVWDALLGSTTTVSTLRGDASLTIPPGTQHGAVLSLHEAGVAPERGGQRRCGAHHFQVQLLVPRQVSSLEQQLLQRLATLQQLRQGT